MLTFNSEKIRESLRCPVCRAKMEISYEHSGLLFCEGERRHCYDFASGGYVNLSSPGQSGGGDSKQAVRARTDFLETGYYSAIRDKLCDLVRNKLGNSGNCANKFVVDAGCGEGYYTSAVAKLGFATAGFDLSKYAVDVASRRAKKDQLGNSFFGVASVYSLPIADCSADAVVNVFAPCAQKEYSRVLKNGGYLLVVCAGPEHLIGLKRALYDKIYINEPRADMPTELMHIGTERLNYDITVNGNANIKNLFSMTPYYWKTSPGDVHKLENIEKLITKIDILFEIYQKIEE